jgi:two-component system KDP operon response regulator KdpE
MAEFLARIAALLRRAARPVADAEGVLTLGPVRFDGVRRTVTVADRPVDLTPHEYELLRVLLSFQGRVVTTGRLLRAVWGNAYEQDVPTLRVFVTQLRRKIEIDPAHPAHILTEPGIGYRFHIGG